MQQEHVNQALFYGDIKWFDFLSATNYLIIHDRLVCGGNNRIN